jgi:hypothetical protein
MGASASVEKPGCPHPNPCMSQRNAWPAQADEPRVEVFTSYGHGLAFGAFGAFGARAEGIGWPPQRMSPGFASSFISLRGPPDALDTGEGCVRFVDQQPL